ncbi:DUF418 domain-containing protein [Hyphomonas sp.]|uniref:DUF418 domain-containing protein n=1 Tax=Hyphomonas sp. TaxID=87 RepID=UPI00391B77CF
MAETSVSTGVSTGASTGRALMPDLIRAFALFGIAAVNVMLFSQPMTTGFVDGGLDQPLDQAAFLGMTGLFLMKSYPLFSTMFGAGLAYQLYAAERAGAQFAPRYFRRMGALIGLGILHFIFFWIGDILLTYGLLGCILFAMRGTSPKTLVRVGIILIAVNTALMLSLGGLMLLGETYAPEQMVFDYSPMTEAALAALGAGSFADAAAWRASQLPMFLPTVLLTQGIATFGFFCFGLAAVKNGVIDNPDAPIWRLSRRVFLPIGLVGSFAGGWMLMQAPSSTGSQFMLGSGVVMAFSAFSSLGYAGLIASISTGEPGPIRRFLARAGSASLTAYLLQSVIFSLIFTAYGLGQYGQMTAGQAIGTAALVALASLVFTGLWRSFAARGPMEVLLRRVTYWGRA